MVREKAQVLTYCQWLVFHCAQSYHKWSNYRVSLVSALSYLHLNFSEGSVLGNELEVLVGEDGGGVDTAHGVAAAAAVAHILTPVLAADPSSTERCCWCCGPPPPPPHHHSTTADRVWRVEFLNSDIGTVSIHSIQSKCLLAPYHLFTSSCTLREHQESLFIS